MGESGGAAALRERGALVGGRGEALDRLTRLAARALRAPVAVLALFAEGRLVVESVFGVAGPLEGSPPAAGAFCRRVAAHGAPLRIDDARSSPPVGVELGEGDALAWRAYAGAPIAAGGEVLGTLSVMDAQPRAWTEDDAAALMDLAGAAVGHLELRAVLEGVRVREASAIELNARLLRDAQVAEEQFRVLFEDAPCAIIVTDPAGPILDANAAAVRLLGFGREELLGQSSSALGLLPPETRARALASVYPRGSLRDHELALMTKSGATRIVLVSIEVVRVGGKERLVSTLVDVTERRRAEELQRQALAAFTDFVEAAPDAILMTDREGTIVAANARSERLFGYRREELLGRSVDMLLPAGIRGRHPAHRARFLASPDARPMSALPDLRALHKDGRELPVEVGLVPLEREGRPIVCAIVSDLTERRRAEARFRAALHAIPDSFYLLEAVRDEGGRVRDFLVVDANEAALRSLPDRRRDALIGARFFALAPPATAAGLFESYCRALAERGPREELLETPLHDGTARWSRLQVVPLPPDGLAVLAQDITRERLEHETSARLAAIVESTDDAVIGESLDGTVTSWNAAAERIFGYSAGEMVGRTLSRLAPPDEGDPPLERLHAIEATGEAAHYETVRRRKDGREVIASITATLIRDAEGRPVSASKLVRDVTAQRSIEAAVRASLKEKEVLLQEVHHRVKNNLQVIASLMNMQLRKLESPPAREALAECQARVLAIALIHEKLYQSKDYANVPFYEYISGLSTTVFQATGVSRTDVTLELDVSRVALPVDKAIPCGLVLNELITNALKHGFPGGRRGRVRVTLVANGGEIALEVSDDGVGLPPGFAAARTKTLGFQLITTLADQLDATLDVFQRGEGAAFRLTFSLDGGERN